MSTALNEHLSSGQYNLPQNVINEVCKMFSDEASSLLDDLSGLKPWIREVVLGALRDYYHAIEQKNSPVFIQVAQVMAFPKKNAANDELFWESNKEAA